MWLLIGTDSVRGPSNSHVKARCVGVGEPATHLRNWTLLTKVEEDDTALQRPRQIVPCQTYHRLEISVRVFPTAVHDSVVAGDERAVNISHKQNPTRLIDFLSSCACIFINLPGYSGERSRGDEGRTQRTLDGDTEKWYGSGRDMHMHDPT